MTTNPEPQRAWSNAFFDADTTVHVEAVNIAGNRLASIRHLEVGDKVLSRCAKTGETAYKRVTRVFAPGSYWVYALRCEYGPRIDARALAPVYVTGEQALRMQGKGWVKVCDLQLGDVLDTHDGGHAELTVKHKETSSTGELYGIEVEDFHTFFVNHAGLWVPDQSQAPEAA